MKTTHLDLYNLHAHDEPSQPQHAPDAAVSPTRRTTGGVDPRYWDEPPAETEVEIYDGDGNHHHTEVWSDLDRASL